MGVLSRLIVLTALLSSALSAVLTAGAIALLAPRPAWAQSTSKVIAAESFEVVKDGQLRARLSVERNGDTSFLLFGTDASDALLGLSVSPGRGGAGRLIMTGPGGAESAAQLGLTTGTEAGPVVALTGRQMTEGGAIINVARDGSGRLFLFEGTGGVAWSAP